jgi:hypothetical protein
MNYDEWYARPVHLELTYGEVVAAHEAVHEFIAVHQAWQEHEDEFIDTVPEVHPDRVDSDWHRALITVDYLLDQAVINNNPTYDPIAEELEDPEDE